MKMKMSLPVAILRIMVLGAALFLASAPAWAHHAMVAQYALNEPITLRGTVTKLKWVNPHSWIHLDVKGADGQVENWAVETGSIIRMEKGGLKRTDFRPGMEIMVGGFLAKNGTRNVAGMYVIFPERKAKASSTPDPAVFMLGR